VEFPEDLVLPPGMEHIELPAEEETLEFWGMYLGGVDTDSGNRPRWAELQLYRYIDTVPGGTYGQEVWLLYTIGHTVVYHATAAAGGSCGMGAEVGTDQFLAGMLNAEDPEDLEPCDDCHPGDWHSAGPDARYNLELTRYRYTPCTSAAMVIQSLHREQKCRECRHRPHEGTACSCGCRECVVLPGELTSPGRRLIEAVRPLDPGIAKAAARKVRL
jgi:hypothetical protein